MTNLNITVSGNDRKCSVYNGIIKYIFHSYFAFCSLFAAPAAAPVFKETVEGNKVTVIWTELPRGQRMGCITKYTIYLESDSGHLQPCKNYFWDFLRAQLHQGFIKKRLFFHPFVCLSEEVT